MPYLGEKKVYPDFLSQTETLCLALAFPCLKSLLMVYPDLLIGITKQYELSKIMGLAKANFVSNINIKLELTACPMMFFFALELNDFSIHNESPKISA